MTDRDVLVAGLLHDCAKGDTGAGPRMAWSLGEAFGTWVLGSGAGPARLGRSWTGSRPRDASADTLAAIGLSPRAVELVRHQVGPRDPEFGRAFKAADEAC